LRAKITISNILEFVSRRGATFSACAKIVGVLEVHFTFSKILDFVKWAKKIPVERLTVEKFFAKLCNENGF